MAAEDESNTSTQNLAGAEAEAVDVKKSTEENICFFLFSHFSFLSLS
jgi:hypothetical protein